MICCNDIFRVCKKSCSHEHFTELLLQPYEIDMFTKIKCTVDNNSCALG